MAKTKHLIISPEYSCYPLWWRLEDGGLINFNAHELEIPEAFADEIEEWGDKYELTYNKDDPAKSGFTDEQLQKEFFEKGQLILKQLKDMFSDKIEIELRLEQSS